MATDISMPVLLSVIGVLTSLATLVGWVIKGGDWVEKQTLRVLRSEDGRDAIVKVHRDHIDGKLDQLHKALDGLGDQIDNMGAKIDRRLDKLDSDVQTMNVRVTLLEKKG